MSTVRELPELPALDAVIMNLSASKEVLAQLEGPPKGFYLLGHRDARHAAAELVCARLAAGEWMAPEGWKLVPVKATPEMHAAYWKAASVLLSDIEFPAVVFKAMAEAAPPPPASIAKEET